MVCMLRRLSKIGSLMWSTPKRTDKIAFSRKISGFAIYDCDPGADDAWGLIMLAKAEEIHNKITDKNPLLKRFKLLAVTCVNGNSNVNNTTRNALRVLKSIDRLDIPVFKGCSDPLIPPTWKSRNNFYGKDGFGDLPQNAKDKSKVKDKANRHRNDEHKLLDIDIEENKGKGKDKGKDKVKRKSRGGNGDENENENKHNNKSFDEESFGLEDDDVDESLIQPQHAVEAMYYYASKYPRKVDFILVGPLTNFAMCINLYGDAFLQKVRRVFIMGGNSTARGNLSKTAEFNFMVDPEAAYVVLERTTCPIIIMPYETCIDGRLGITLEWRFKVPGSANSKAVKLMNVVDKAVYTSKNSVDWLVCDAMLVAAYLFPSVAISEILSYHATVELFGKHTRGQMVLDHLREEENNAILIMRINGEMFKKIAAWSVGVESEKVDTPT